MRLVETLLKTKRPEIWAYITGKSDNLGKAVAGGYKEWASVGVPSAMRGHRGQMLRAGQSYYSGVGGNGAHISANEFANALKIERERYLSTGKTGLSVYAKPVSKIETKAIIY
jgi:hypothetical protein